MPSNARSEIDASQREDRAFSIWNVQDIDPDAHLSELHNTDGIQCKFPLLVKVVCVLLLTRRWTSANTVNSAPHFRTCHRNGGLVHW